MLTVKINLMKKSIQIQVVSDVACPWCYIGKKRLEKAIAQTKDLFEVDVVYKPFQLDPSIPQEGKAWKTYFEDKFGSVDRIDAIFNRVEATGAAVGIDFKFRDIPQIPNTLPLHIILEQALAEGIQTQVANTLFTAYMEQPQDLTKLEVLQSIMLAYGWSAEKTEELIQNPEKKKAVKTQIAQAQKLGITGVPFFIINDQYGISGAQPEEVFIEAFKSIEGMLSTKEEGTACDVDGSNC